MRCTVAVLLAFLGHLAFGQNNQLNSLLSSVNPQTLRSVPPQCYGPAQALSGCQNDLNELQQRGGNPASLSADQVASLARQYGLSSSCCQGIGTLISSGCACQPSVQSIIDQTGTRNGYEGLKMALPDTCKIAPAPC